MAEAAETLTTSTEQPEASAGLPQFQFQHWAGQIAYLLILFVILYVLMLRVFAPRIRRIFDQRETTINDAIASARQVQAEAARTALAGARGKAQKTASDAKAKAEAEAKARQAVEEAKLNERLAVAETEIRAARDSAMANVNTVATETAQAIIEKLTGKAASNDQLDAALAKLQG